MKQAYNEVVLVTLILAVSFFGQQAPYDPPLLRKESDLTCADWANVANHYVSVGEQGAVEELLDRTSDKPSRYAISNEHACHICRLLYEPKPGKKLRRPLLGASILPDGSSGSDARWPEFPFTLQDGVWFLLTDSYMGAGGREQVDSYIRYCKTNGVFRRGPLMVPTAAQAKRALGSLLKSDRWDPWHGQKWKSTSRVDVLRQQTEY